MFNNFSAVDRQTELTDDDGSLTGYAHTTSVNEDLFFKAPVEGPECQSDLQTPVYSTASKHSSRHAKPRHGENKPL